MEPLGPPDSVHLRAAEGWLGLGDHESANQELEKISTDFQTHPAVLETRYCVYAATKKWDACVDVGRKLVELKPNQSFGWVNRSYAILLGRAVCALCVLCVRSSGHWSVVSAMLD